MCIECLRVLEGRSPYGSGVIYKIHHSHSFLVALLDMVALYLLLCHP